MDCEAFLRDAVVSDDVFALRPDYRVDLVAASGVRPDADGQAVDQLIARSEHYAREMLASTPVAEIPHIASWRQAFKAFGAKPSDYRNSAEALLRRAPGGLPRINPLTDVYNALSVLHQTPIGGENLDVYEGPARLTRARGDEEFDTVSGGEGVIEHPAAGEVVWRDDRGVTCRRWNWRQCTRTQLTENTANVLFIIDTLDPLSAEQRNQVVDDLTGWLERLGGEDISRRTLLREHTP